MYAILLLAICIIHLIFMNSINGNITRKGKTNGRDVSPSSKNLVPTNQNQIRLAKKLLKHLAVAIKICRVIVAELLDWKTSYSYSTPKKFFKNNSDNSWYELNLQKDVFRDYNSQVHPGESWGGSGKVLVKFDAQVIRILQVDEKEQFIQVYLWVNQYWNNPLLTWKPSDYNNVSLIHVTSSKVWVPDIVLYNDVDEDRRVAGEDKTKILVAPNGDCTWYHQVIVKSICRIDVSYFPFDDQQCRLKFGSWAFDSSKIDMEPLKANSPLNKYYIPNGEWTLQSITAKRNQLVYQCCNTPFVDITITISIRRAALNYALTLIIPCALLSSLIVLGFILPPESGERIGLSITVLLAVTVFQQLTTQIMPSYDFPYLAQYYLATIVETGFSLVVTTVILNFYHRSHRKMPYILKLILLDWVAPLLFCKCAKKKKRMDANMSDTTVSESDIEMETMNSASAPLQITVESPRDELLKPNEHCHNKPANYKKLNQRRNNSEHADTEALLHGPSTGGSIESGWLADNLQRRATNVIMAAKCRDIEIKERQREWLKAVRVLDRLALILFIFAFTATLIAIFFRAPRFRL